MYRQYEKLKRLKEALANLKREYKLALENNAGEEMLIGLHDDILLVMPFSKIFAVFPTL